MELIANILTEYLKHNKRIVVPNLGVFIVKLPDNVIRFSELMRNDDGTLRSLLMASGISEIEASGKIDRFVFEVRHAIKQGREFGIKGLGIFSSGENNTIVFKHTNEPSVYGGNIKPPIETLEVEKQRLYHAERRTRPQHNTTPSPTPTPKVEQSKDLKHVKRDKKEDHKRRNKRNEVFDDNTISLGRPDAYLRGLNYDKSKKKQRDDRSDSRRRRGVHPMFIVLLIALLSIGILWLAWQIFGGEPIKFDIDSLRRTKNEVTSVETPATLSDTLIMDVDGQKWIIDGSTSKDRAIEGIVAERDTTSVSKGDYNIVTE